MTFLEKKLSNLLRFNSLSVVKLQLHIGESTSLDQYHGFCTTVVFLCYHYVSGKTSFTEVYKIEKHCMQFMKSRETDNILLE